MLTGTREETSLWRASATSLGTKRGFSTWCDDGGPWRDYDDRGDVHPRWRIVRVRVRSGFLFISTQILSKLVEGTAVLRRLRRHALEAVYLRSKRGRTSSL